MKNSNLDNFQNSWEMVLDGMRSPPPEEVLEHFNYEAVKSHRGIAEDIAHYERLEEGSGGDRSYSYFYNAVGRYIRRTRHGQVRRELCGTLSDLRPLTSPTGPVKNVSRSQGCKDQGKRSVMIDSHPQGWILPVVIRGMTKRCWLKIAKFIIICDK